MTKDDEINLRRYRLLRDGDYTQKNWLKLAEHHDFTDGIPSGDRLDDFLDDLFYLTYGVEI